MYFSKTFTVWIYTNCKFTDYVLPSWSGYLVAQATMKGSRLSNIEKFETLIHEIRSTEMKRFSLNDLYIAQLSIQLYLHLRQCHMQRNRLMGIVIRRCNTI